MVVYLVESMHNPTTTDIVEFHRHDDGSCEKKVIKNYKPYFFVDTTCPIERLDGVIKTEPGFVSILNTPVKKVFVQKSTFIMPLRKKIVEMGFKHWEADILFHNRYTMDLPEEMAKPQLKVCWLDIETATEDENCTKFPDIETADQIIACLTTRIGDEKTTWLCGATDVEGTRYFPDEADMMDDFMSFMYKESPDIISAWNLDGFDLPYIIRRCKRIGVDYKRLSKVMQVWEKEIFGKKYTKVYGTVMLDLLDAYKLWRKYGNLPLLASYSLDFVAQAVLGEQKLELNKTFSWLWKHAPDKLVEYNIKDVDLLHMIDERCKVVRFFDEIRRKCRVQFEDVYKTTAMIDGYLMTRLKGSIILPTAVRRKGDKFGGAYVFDPVPGLYDYVLCQDIASMYPSIIKNFNISYETVGGGDIILPLESRVSFSKKPGIIPMFLDELKKERTEYKKLRKEHEEGTAEWQLYDQRQFATKIIMNSFFGYLGYPSSRLYKKTVASAITGMGMYIILEIAKWVKENGNKVVYGDTDSVYITSNAKDKYGAIMEGMKIADVINNRLEELAVGLSGWNALFIEFEKAFKRVLFTDAKKRYAYTLLWDADVKYNVDDKIHVQGFDSKRSDSNVVSKIAQRKVIEMIINGESNETVIKFVRDLDAKMKRGGFSDEEIGFPKGITKELNEYMPPPAIVKGAQYSNEHFGTQYGKATKPKFVYITSYKGEYPTVEMKNKEYKLETIAYDTKIPDGFRIDWKKMSDRTFKNKLIKLFTAVSWVWEDLENTSLLDKW